MSLPLSSNPRHSTRNDGRGPTGRRAFGLALASLLLAVAALAGCSDDDTGTAGGNRAEATASDDPGEPGPTNADGRTGDTDGGGGHAIEVEVLDADDPDFYVVPDPIPDGAPGDLLRTQPVAGAPEGVTWQRIMYLSETVAGDPTVVTGVLTLPDDEPPEEGWPLFSHAHGSTGMADPCAPSISLTEDKRFALEIILLSSQAAARDIAVVSSDYEGLGGPGLHPFLVGESEGRGVLDAIRAARQVPDTRFAEAVGIVGYSQGGHAAAWANEIAPDWAPELDIAGVLAGAPATEVPEMAADAGGAGVLLVAALATTGDEFDPATVLTDAGLDALDQLDRVCQDEVQVSGDLVSADLNTTEPWASGLAAQVPGSEPGAAPVLIVHSREDLSVPIDQSAAFQARLCAAGQVVERRVLPSGDHVTAAVPAYEQGLDWITAIVDGQEPTSTCP